MRYSDDVIEDIRQGNDIIFFITFPDMGRSGQLGSGYTSIRRTVFGCLPGRPPFSCHSEGIKAAVR